MLYALAMTTSSGKDSGRGVLGPGPCRRAARAVAALHDSLDLIEGLEMALKDDRSAQQMRKCIIALQKQLRRGVDDGAWSIYLRLEHAVNERTYYILTKLAPELMFQEILGHLQR